MVWALTGWPHPPPSPSTSAALIRLFPKQNVWIWRWASALNFFGRPWRGLFWVEPLLLNRCMVLATVLQLCFRVLASSYSLRHLYVEQQYLRVLCHELPCWTSSDQYERVRAIAPNLTHLLPIHTWDLLTLTSHMTPGRENGELGLIWTFSLKGVLTFVVSGLDINGCVWSYFEGTANVQCYTSCTLTTLRCSKVSFLQYCHMKRYNKIFTKMWGVYSLLWDTVLPELPCLWLCSDLLFFHNT